MNSYSADGTSKAKCQYTNHIMRFQNSKGRFSSVKNYNYLFYNQNLNLKYELTNMNRSIAKTRNQLQRITLKINQLKNKYTTDNLNSNFVPSENSPSYHHGKEKDNFNYSNTKTQPSNLSLREPMIMNFQNRQSVPNTVIPSHNTLNTHSSSYKNLGANPMQQSASHRNQEEKMEKQFKLFKNQIHKMIESLLQKSKAQTQKQREQAIERGIERLMQKERYGLRQKNGLMDERIKKIEGEITNCIGNIQDLIVNSKKSQKSVAEQLERLQNSINLQKNEISQLSSSKQNVEKIKLQMMSKLQQKVEQISSEIFTINQQIIEKIPKITDYIKQLQEKHNNLNKQFKMELSAFTQTNKKTLQGQFHSFDSKFLLFNERISKLQAQTKKKAAQIQQIKEDIEMLANQSLKREEQQEDQKIIQQANKQLYERVNLIEEGIKKCLTDLGSVSQSVLSLEQRHQQLYQIIENENQNIGKEQLEQSKEVQDQIGQRLQALQEKLTQLIEDKNIQSRLKDLQRGTTQIIKHELQKQSRSIQQQISNLQTVRDFKIESVLNQFKNSLFDDVEGFLAQFGTKLQQKLQQKIAASKSQSTVIVGDKNKVKEADLTIVEEKLNQFQTDINETIKLLYQDIQNKVTEMLQNVGFFQFKNQQQITKKIIHEIQQKNQDILIHISNRAPSLTQTSSSFEALKTLKQEVFFEIANQIDKMSNLLERALEGMENKVQKLQHNFTYLYQRMSNIEYDNASFKDTLTSILNKKNSPPNNNSPIKQTKASNSQNDNLLDMLGHFTAGKHFYQQQ